MPAAAHDYQQAIENGMNVAGHVFLAQAQTQAGKPDAAAATLAELGTVSGDAAHLQLNPDDSGALGALNKELTVRAYPSVTLETAPRFHHLYDIPANLSLHLLDSKLEDTGAVELHALLGAGAYVGCPVGQWDVILFSPTDYVRYAEASQSILAVPGALIEWTMTIAVTTQPLPASIGVKAAAGCNTLVQYMPEYATIQP
jgi:hypothetical protein